MRPSGRNRIYRAFRIVYFAHLPEIQPTDIAADNLVVAVDCQTFAHIGPAKYAVLPSSLPVLVPLRISVEEAAATTHLRLFRLPYRLRLLNRLWKKQPSPSCEFHPNA